MYLSLSSFVTFQFVNSIILIMIILLMRFLGDSRLVSHNILYIFCVLFILRLIVPFEFLHTVTLPSKFLLPAIYELLAHKIVFFQSDIVITVSSILIFIWLLVLGVKLIRFLGSYTKLKSLSRLCSDSDQLIYRDKSLKILLVDEHIPPSVIGVFSPIIILPRNGFSKREKEMILSHEIMHISNFDLYIKYIYFMVSIVYWWNPLIYLFKDRMVQIMEIRADSNLSHTFDDQQKIEYVETLVKVSKIYSKSSNQILSLNFSTKSHSNLLQRSKYILCGSKKQISFKIIMAIVLTLFFLSSAIVFEPYAVDSETEFETYDISPENSYFIKNGDNYDMYVNNNFFISYKANKIPKEFINIKLIDDEIEKD